MKSSLSCTVAALAATCFSAHAALISGVTLSSFSSQISAVDRMAINTIDGSGLSGTGSASDTHGATPEDMWLTAGSIIPFGGPDYDPTITFNLSAVYNVDTLRVWNFNEAGFTKHGARQVLVTAGATLATMNQSLTINLAQAAGTGAEAAQNFAASFTGVQFVRFTINSNWDGDDFVNNVFAGSTEQFAGVSEVRFEGSPIPEPGMLALVGVAGAAMLTRNRRRERGV